MEKRTQRILIGLFVYFIFAGSFLFIKNIYEIQREEMDKIPSYMQIYRLCENKEDTMCSVYFLDVTKEQLGNCNMKTYYREEDMTICS